MLTRCQDITPDVIFIELCGCKPKFSIRLKCGKPGHKNGNSGFPGKS